MDEELTTIHCPHCGKSSPEEFLSCIYCGRRLPVRVGFISALGPPQKLALLIAALVAAVIILMVAF